MRDVENRIERHQQSYISLTNNSVWILFCSRCWDCEQKLIKVKCYNSGAFKCTHCENNGTYDKAMYEEHLRKEREAFSVVNTRNRRNYI